MENKTYEQRLAEIAEEFAMTRLHEGALIDMGLFKVLVEQHKPLAAIALKHMAECYREGYIDGIANEYNIQSTGLIQPQKP